MGTRKTKKKKFMLVLMLFALAFSFMACDDADDDSSLSPEDNPGGLLTTKITERTPSFGFARNYDTGADPRVAITADGIAVEVHKSENADELYYHLGRINEKGYLAWEGSVHYDGGNTPDVAVNAAGTVVEVHRTNNIFFQKDLYYHVGRVSGNSISWGGSIKYDAGYFPRVAINDNGTAAEVHRGENRDDLYYKVGSVNTSNNSIAWGGSMRYDTGAYPDVAVNKNGVVVEVHQANSNSNLLYYYVGRVSGSTITWGAPVNYDTGYNPSVDITDDGLVFEAHESSGKLYYRSGVVKSDNSITWHAGGEFDSGKNVSVACGGDHAIQVHKSETFATLWFTNSLLIDRKRWMQNTPGILDQPLWTTVLPGTHDSGAYNLTTEFASCSEVSTAGDIIRQFAEAQSKSLGDQLNGGIRFFDIRPVFHNNDFYTYHALICKSPFSTELDGIAAFLASAGPELVIMKIDAFCSFSDAEHERFVKLINDKIGRWLYKGPVSNLLTMTVGELTSNGNVLLWYNNSYTESHPAEGFLRSLPIYDEYANSPKVGDMWENQRTKLRDHGGTPSNLFLLSWTLTFNAYNPQNLATSLSYGSLYNMSRSANAELGNFINETYNGIPSTDYQMNILYVDFFEESQNVDYAVWLNSLYN